MRILLDENLDWRLGRALPGHEVESVTRLGWAGIQNGLLLKKVVLRARSNRLADTSPLMVKVGRALPFLENGTVTVVE